jgi:hypothetical protein
VAEAALAGDLDSGNRGDRYQVVVHTGETATYIEDGADVSAETFLRLYCDSSTVEMKHGSEGNVLDFNERDASAETSTTWSSTLPGER